MPKQYAGPVKRYHLRLQPLQLLHLPGAILGQHIVGLFKVFRQNSHLCLHIAVCMNMRLIQHGPTGKFLTVSPDVDLHCLPLFDCAYLIEYGCEHHKKLFGVAAFTNKYI